MHLLVRGEFVVLRAQYYSMYAQGLMAAGELDRELTFFQVGCRVIDRSRQDYNTYVIFASQRVLQLECHRPVCVRLWRNHEIFIFRNTVGSMDACVIGAFGISNNQTCALTLGLYLTLIGCQRREWPLACGVECAVTILSRGSAIENAALIERTMEHVILRIAPIVHISN